MLNKHIPVGLSTTPCSVWTCGTVCAACESPDRTSPAADVPVFRSAAHHFRSNRMPIRCFRQSFCAGDAVRLCHRDSLRPSICFCIFCHCRHGRRTAERQRSAKGRSCTAATTDARTFESCGCSEGMRTAKCILVAQQGTNKNNYLASVFRYLGRPCCQQQCANSARRNATVVLIISWRMFAYATQTNAAVILCDANYYLLVGFEITLTVYCI